MTGAQGADPKSFFSAADAPAPTGEAPGEFPYTRGIRATKKGGWIQRGLSGEGDPNRSNAQLKALLARGQTGVDVIGDSPTMALLDPDHPLAASAVGSQGVSLCRLDDYRELLAGIPLESMTISSSVPAPFFVAGLFLVAQERGMPADRLRGSVLQPPLYAEDCGYAMQLPLQLRLRLSCDSVQFCSERLPKFHGFLEDTYFFSEVGLTPSEEMALGFLEIRCVARALIARGVPIDQFAPRIAVLVNCGMSMFHEVAKIRATRRLFATLMRDELGAKDPRSHAVVITSHTSGLSLTAQQPVNNVIRGTVQAMTLVMAGVQALEISAFDEGFRTPSPEAHLVGLRTQQILQLETDIAEAIDPLGGSHYVEKLTAQVEAEIRGLIAKYDAMGDTAELCERGVFAELFTMAMARRARALEQKSLIQVGVNAHLLDPSEDHLLRGVSEEKGQSWAAHLHRVTAWKGGRDPAAVRRAIAAVRAAADDRGANLMPALIAGLQQGLSVGEMADAMRASYGAKAVSG